MNNSNAGALTDETCTHCHIFKEGGPMLARVSARKTHAYTMAEGPLSFCYIDPTEAANTHTIQYLLSGSKP